MVAPTKQFGLNLSNLDRQLTNEISLLKLSIRKQLGLPVSNTQFELTNFDKLKQAGSKWQEYLIQTVPDCNITKYRISEADEDDLYQVFVNVICNVFSSVQVYWPQN